MKEVRIVVVDDNARFREALRSFVDVLPACRVVGEAENGEEAICIVNEKAPEVVLMDIDMPVLNGMEASSQIKRDWGEKIKIIIVSQYNERVYVHKMKEIGVDGYISKSDIANNLGEAMSCVVHDKLFFEEEQYQL